MRDVSERWKELVAAPVRWDTVVQWSNTGGAPWQDCQYLPGGTVTASATSQVRWTCGVRVLGPELGRGGINPFSTRIRILHGMSGEPLLPMGVYKVVDASWSSEWPAALDLSGESFEVYMRRARFLRPRTLVGGWARSTLAGLITEVLPGALISWDDRVDADLHISRMEAPRDRWELVDGPAGAKSIARAVGARVFAGPAGEWVVAPVPSLEDEAVWVASEGPGGVLITHQEELSDEGVYNAVVANGVPDDGETVPFEPGVAVDDDPLSLTYFYRSPDEGGFGEAPRFYASPLLRTTLQASKAARSMLAPFLGLKQQVSFIQLHDPSIEPGDVGIVNTRKGPRKAIPDSITYSLDGEPMTFSTRTTATRLAGEQVNIPEGEADVTVEGEE